MLLVHEMLRRSARDLPGKEAVAFRGERISFLELDERSSRLAALLRSGGVEKGMRVAIFSVKCAEEVVAIFAIAKAGGVLVHINPYFRDDKLRHVIRECEPAALFFHESKRPAVERAGEEGILPGLLISMGPGAVQDSTGSALRLETLLQRSGPPAEGGCPSCGDDDLAAIIYTSGTTASAKGIMVTHRILSESTTVSAQLLENVAADRLISITPFSFDGALSQLFTAVLAGGTLVLQDSHFPRDVVATLLSERITGFHAVPSFWRMMLARYPAFAQLDFPHLRYLSLIGETFPEAELARLKEILRHTEFFMMYGTTEAFRSTCLPPADFDRKRGSVGKPLPGVEIAIVDGEGNPLQRGEVGEIVHRGVFVSPGYWKRKGGATFRGDGVHTGDLGMLDEEGYLYFVARKDTMIKRMGQQIYPEEIEGCLMRLAGVEMAAVVLLPDAGGGPRMHASVVPRPGAELSREAVVRHCREQLPHYMMPDEITLCSSLPTTGTFKVDRGALSLPERP